MTRASTVQVAFAAVTAGASLWSFTGSAFMLVCYTILPFDGHFRHILILNLTMSDLLHAMNNMASDLYIVIRRRSLDPGAACVFNGFVGQVTAQATDCSILAISIATVYAITRRITISSCPGRLKYRRMAILICSIWAFPFLTGFLALGMGWYAPVSGSWCWIKGKPIYLRYLLAHGWRMFFIVLEIGLYIYLDAHLRRHYQVEEIPPWDGCLGHLASDTESSVQTVDEVEKRDNSSSTSPVTLIQQNKSFPEFRLFSRISSLRDRFPSNTRYLEVQKMLLLNAYPLGYIILWLPDIANRLIEATGRSSRAMQFLQVAAQLVGLANALTYGWNENVKKQLEERFSRR